jgi:hypothetical protein
MAMIDAAVDLYNHLPLMAEVRVESSALTRAQDAAGEIIRSGRANGYAAISLLHRHFDLESGIVPVWRVEHGEMRMRPSAHDGAQHIPVTWRSSAGNAPIPVEFASADLLPEYLKLAMRSGQFGQFSAQMFARLSTVDPQARFGLTVTPSLFSEFFFPGNTQTLTNQSFHEILGGAGEFTKIVPSSLSVDGSVNIVDTVWWMPNGKMRVAIGCHCRY